MKNLIARNAAWGAYLSGICALLSFAAYIAFLALDLPQTQQGGNLNRQTLTGDLIGIFQGLSILFMIPLAIALHERVDKRAARISRITMVIGVASMIGLLGFTLLITLHYIPETQGGVPISLFFGGIGIWLVAANYHACRTILPTRLAWLGIVIGAAYILFVLTYWGSGAANVESSAALQSNVLFLGGYAAFSLSSFILYPIWVIWLGRGLLKLTAKAMPAARITA